MNEEAYLELSRLETAISLLRDNVENLAEDLSCLAYKVNDEERKSELLDMSERLIRCDIDVLAEIECYLEELSRTQK